MKKKLETNFELNYYSNSTVNTKPGKNTLKSRIHGMDKGWISKKREIKGMNRLNNKISLSLTGSLF